MALITSPSEHAVCARCDRCFGPPGQGWDDSGHCDDPLCPNTTPAATAVEVRKYPDTSTNPKDLIGAKKPPITLVPPIGIIEESMAFDDGAVKYGPYNWRDNPVQARIYLDAAYRHIMAWQDGESHTRDSRGNVVHHLGAARACLAILLDAESLGNLKDDRPKAGKAADAIERLTKK